MKQVRYFRTKAKCWHFTNNTIKKSYFFLINLIKIKDKHLDLVGVFERANNHCEWMWRIYFRGAFATFALETLPVIASAVHIWHDLEQWDDNEAYHPYKIEWVFEYYFTIIPWVTTSNELMIILVFLGTQQLQLDILEKQLSPSVELKVIYSLLVHLPCYSFLYAHIIRLFMKYFETQYAKRIKKELIRSFYANWYVFISQPKSKVHLQSIYLQISIKS